MMHHVDVEVIFYGGLSMVTVSETSYFSMVQRGTQLESNGVEKYAKIQERKVELYLNHHRTHDTRLIDLCNFISSSLFSLYFNLQLSKIATTTKESYCMISVHGSLWM